jgi:hypothetical protein
MGAGIIWYMCHIHLRNGAGICVSESTKCGIGDEDLKEVIEESCLPRGLKNACIQIVTLPLEMDDGISCSYSYLDTGLTKKHNYPSWDESGPIPRKYKPIPIHLQPPCHAMAQGSGGLAQQSGGLAQRSGGLAQRSGGLAQESGGLAAGTGARL